MCLILPVEPLDNHFTAGFDFIRQLPEAQKQLIDHSSLIEENQVKHQAECRSRDDNWEKINRAEKLSSYPDGIHQESQDQCDAHLKDDRTEDKNKGIF